MAAIELRRFSTTVFRDKSGSDLAQIPLDSATVAIYRQGATVSAGTTVTTSNTAVSVYNTGRVAVGDQLQLGTDTTSLMIVVTVDSDTQLTIKRTSGSDITVSAGDRLVIRTNRPTVYADSTGTVTATNSPNLSTDATGAVSFYTAEPRFDYIVSGTSITTTLYIDAEGGWTRGGTGWVNVRDYPTFQDAINALSPTYGGTLYVPAGVYNSSTTPTVGVMTFANLNGRVRIIGDGMNKTHIYSDSSSTDLMTFHGIQFIEIEGIKLVGTGVAGAGRGIVLDCCDLARIRNVWINKFSSWGIETLNDTGTDSSGISIEDCYINENASNGGVKYHAATYIPVMKETWIEPNTGYCVYASGCFRPSFHNCVFENALDATPYLYFDGSEQVGIYGCWFETSANNATPTAWFVHFNENGPTSGHVIDACRWIRTGAAVTKLRAIKSVGFGANFYIGPQHASIQTVGWNGTDDIVLADDDFCVLAGRQTIVDATYASTLDWRVSQTNGGTHIIRAGSNKRIKPLSMTVVVRDALTDKLAGDMVHASEAGQLGAIHFYDGSVWRSVGSVNTASGAPSTGTWAVGDFVVNTNDNKLYICVAAGSPGTWKASAALT